MKKKGFTLVELLAVIVIMGIILLVAIPGVFGISKTIKDNMYCTKVHNIESAAKLYGNDYQDDFDDKGYIKVDVKTIIDNNLYKKETDECVLGDNDKGCITDPRDESVMDNNTITIVKTGSRFYAYYDFINEEDIALCEGKKEADKFKHYDVALDGQGATYPGTTIVRDVIFGHEMPNIEVPRREYKVRLIDEYNHLDKTEIVKYTFRGYFAAKNGGVKYYDENGKNVHYYNLPDGRPLYAVWTDKSINLPKQTFTGYDFRGWFTSRTGADFIMESGNYTPTSDITLYARWVPKVSTITLDNQSATVEGTKKIEATYNEPFPNVTIPQKEYSVTLNYNGSGTPNTTLKSKNIFDGYWSQRNGKGTQYYDSTGKGIGVSKFTSNATIYANWKNGSITLPNASRPYYKFLGWYTAASGGTKVGNAGSNYNATKNVTLYAQWKMNDDGRLERGSAFKNHLTGLAGNSSNIKYIKKSNTPPPSGVKTENVAYHLSEMPIYAWFDNGTIYLYSPNNKFIMNSDSRSMFSSMNELISIQLNIFDTSQVTDMSYMFYTDSKLIDMDLSKFNTSKVTNMAYMFYCLKSITTINVSSFDTSNVTNMESMFAYNYYEFSPGLHSSELRHIIGLEKFNTSKVTNMSRMFAARVRLEELNVSSFDTSNVIYMDNMFASNGSLKSLDVSNFNTSKVTNMYYMFARCTKLESLNLSSFDTSNVRNMAEMFSYMSTIKSLDLRNFRTSNVTDMHDMFYGNESLTYLNVSSFDTSKVTNMAGMFASLKNLTSLNVANFNTSNVVDMQGMFSEVSKVDNLDLKNFNTSRVTNMSGMFYGMNKLASLNVSSFDTSNVTDMSGMFHYCIKLKNLDLRNFNTSNLVDMAGMFAWMWDLTSLDLSSFDTSKVTKVIGNHSCGAFCIYFYDLSMFDNDSSLKTIYVSNKWNMSNVSSNQTAFSYNRALVGGSGTKYSDSHKEVAYARIDGVGGPGYFTRK